MPRPSPRKKPDPKLEPPPKVTPVPPLSRISPVSFSPLPDTNTDPIFIRGPIVLPSSAERVSDADEDVFLLYSRLQGLTTAEGRGLGYFDNMTDLLNLTIELKAPRVEKEEKEEKKIKGSLGRKKGKSKDDGEKGDAEAAKGKGKEKTTSPPPEDTKQDQDTIPSPTEQDKPLSGKEKRKARKGKGREKSPSPTGAIAKEDITIEMQLAQDMTALRSREGDTGSVVWRASVDFAKLILEQIYFHPTTGLFDLSLLKSSHVLELGSGTGLLPLLLSPHVSTYTSTDLPALLTLQKKSLTLNPPQPPNLTLHPLDWTHIYTTPHTHRRKIFKPPHPLDLLLLIDCIYHPSLLPALITTMEYLTTPDKTAVLVICELRADDVVREFLKLWLCRPKWDIWRLEDGAGLGGQYGVWVACREEL